MAGSTSKANGRQSQKRKQKFPKYEATRNKVLHMFCPECNKQYALPAQECYIKGGRECSNRNNEAGERCGYKLQMRHDLNAVVRTPITKK